MGKQAMKQNPSSSTRTGKKPLNARSATADTGTSSPLTSSLHHNYHHHNHHRHNNFPPSSDIIIDEGIQNQPAECPPTLITPTENESEEHMSLLELGEETMAQAMLIFLLADLRILSATGRIRTRFEHLALDSDRSPRLTSRDYAGFYDYDETDGVTASHIMAILLVEILREAEDVSKDRTKKRSRRRRRYVHKPALLSPWANTESTTAGVNARQVFKRDIRAANGMPSLLHCYNEMLSEDVNPRIARVSRRQYPLDEDVKKSSTVLVPDTGWIDRRKSDIQGTNSVMADLHEDEISLGGESLPLTRNSTPVRHSTPPAIPNSQGHHHVEPSVSTLLSHQQDPIQGLDKSGNSLAIGSTSANRLHRRASVNFQISHFNPNVDIEEDDDDDSIQFLSEKRIKNNDEPTSPTSAPCTNMMNTSMPALNYKFKEIRERVEKAIPEQLAIRVTELTKSFPKGPAARQQQELDEIAQVQNQLLNWGDEEESEEFIQPLHTSSHHSRGEGSKRQINTSRQQLKISEVDANESRSSIGEDNTFGLLSPSSDDDDFSLYIPEYHDSDTIRSLIIQALDKRDFSRLGFLKTFFREGTVSHVLANSRAEMVWLSDWHTQYECTYAISIDREKEKVLLAFRGAYTESDWRHIVDWYDTATSNPVKDAYPNRPANIRLHSGFHKYLFRVRKDTQTTKYDEITAKLAHYCKLTGPHTRITITGHSLGAALAAIFSLYASTEERFTEKCGAIECVTFGAPCIGNWRFAGAVKHQENLGKLRIAKFHVKGDSVPHLPPALIRYSSRGAQYWHSGIDVSLPYIRKGKLFQTILGGQPKPKITYWDPDEESYLGSLLRQFREYYVWNLPLRFWRFALFHTLVEHKKRMALVSKSDPNSLLTKYSLKELYDMREELTRRPFWRRGKNTRAR